MGFVQSISKCTIRLQKYKQSQSINRVFCLLTTAKEEVKVMANKAFKFRIYPTSDQKVLLAIRLCSFHLQSNAIR
ncbi:MAG: helix-turn-helix domain-containing protein [Allobaculum sp.]|nr:helix-turn-helix domain-containing protein [Allobaculum sp.]